MRVLSEVLTAEVLEGKRQARYRIVAWYFFIIIIIHIVIVILVSRGSRRYCYYCCLSCRA